MHDLHLDHFAVEAQRGAFFRTEHGHGPSFRQLCEGLGWDQNRGSVRTFIVQRLLLSEWLTSTGRVSWILRPVEAAQEPGTALPRARSCAAATTPVRP